MEPSLEPVPHPAKARHRVAVSKFRLVSDWIKNVLEVDRRTVRSFRQARVSTEYRLAFEKEKPLVSICVGTYNRADVLTQRCLPSILNQTYPHLEVIVVGDCCTDHTAAKVADLLDSRIQFVNLPRRGNYPAQPKLRWMVAGTEPINTALRLSRGDFISHLDDDDEYLPDRVEKLLRHVRENRLDLAFHPFLAEDPDGNWYLRPAHAFAFGQVTTSSVLYHGWFKRIQWNPRAYRWYEPGDWNRFRKFRYLGAKTASYPEPLLRHYRERAQGLDPARASETA